jgi:hypothetical protein
MKKTKEKAIMALMAGRRVVGQRWGLKPAMMRWIYFEGTLKPLGSSPTFFKQKCRVECPK